MKTLKYYSLLIVLLSFSFAATAQTSVTETVPVAGNCGMCKSTIEKAATKAGATSAEWDVEGKKLTVTFASSSTSLAKIQEAVAASGYDTRDVKATDAAYNKLHACCKYERANATKDAAAHCMVNCEMKDGKCTKMEECKAKGCCKNEADCKDKGCCKGKADHASASKADHASAGKAASCCAKEGDMAAHDAKNCAKDCCKK